VRGRAAHAMPRDGTDRAVLELLDADLGARVVRVVRRAAGLPSYELHLATGERRGGAVWERAHAVMRLAALRLGVAMTWHVLAGTERRTLAEPGRLLYPGLAIVRPT
jgi:hypothetical protein